MLPARQQRAAEIARHSWTVMNTLLNNDPEALAFYTADDFKTISFRLAGVVEALDALEGNQSMEIPMIPMDNPVMFILISVWIEKMSEKYPVADLIELYMVRRPSKNWNSVGGTA